MFMLVWKTRKKLNVQPLAFYELVCAHIYHGTQYSNKKNHII